MNIYVVGGAKGIPPFNKYIDDLYTIDEVVNGFRNKNIISVFRSFYCT